MRRHTLGFTLLELMLTIMLASLVMAVGVPSFKEFRRNTRLTSAANEFLGAAFAARSEALKRQTPIAVCGSDDPTSGGAACNGGTFTGWIVFVDANNDCLRQAGEPVIRAQPTLDATVTPSADGNCLSFNLNGFRQLIPGRTAVGHALFCDERGNTALDGGDLAAPRGVEIQPTGRGRISRSHAELSAWTGAFGVACP